MNQTGLSLLELLITITLGLFITLGLSSFLLASKTIYVTHMENALMHDTAATAFHTIAHAIRQTDYIPWDTTSLNLDIMSELSPGITGLDEKSLSATSEDIRFPVHSTAHSSDILALRFYGSSQPTSTSARTSAAHIADNTIQNCAGFGIAAPENTQTERAWSIYYVATGATGEPELFCKYQGKKGWRATAIARGIASFQVRYGFNHTSTDFMSASQLHALDAALPLTGSTPSARTIELHQKSHWKKVTSVQISILLRSAKIAGSHATSLNKALLQRTHGERLQRVFSIIIQRQNFAY